MRRGVQVRVKCRNKSRATRRQRCSRWKQSTAALHTNPARARAALCLQRSLKMYHRGLGNQSLVARWSAGIDADASGDEEDICMVGKTMTMACPAFEFASDASLTGDGNDVITAIEEALHREFGIYENAVEGANFAETHFARRWGSVLSMESWTSDDEFLDTEQESSEDNDDDWYMVVAGEDDV